MVRADVFGPPEVLRLVREPLPGPGPGELLIRVDGVGVNFADTMFRTGTYRRGQMLPCIPGVEVTGTVVAAGDGEDFERGICVIGFLEAGGGYADHVVAPRDRVYRVPADLPAELRAALFVHGVTAWYAVHRFGKVAPGETVLVHAGAGGLGGVCVQLARLSGATVLATASTEDKRALVRSRGALALESDPASLQDAVRTATGGEGCDVVIDSVGGSLFEPSFGVLGNRGRYVVAGSTSQAPALLDVRRLMPRAQTVVGFIVRRVIEVDPSEPQATIDQLVDLLRTGILQLPVTALRLEEAAEAHRLLESRRSTGKIVLLPD